MYVGLLVVLATLASATSAASQQGVRVRVPENFRKDPNGVVLGRLSVGTPLRAVGTEGNWTQVELEGWVWLRSLRATSDEGFDLVVSVDGGENLRATPAGDVQARLEPGALLDEVEQQPAWARVRRVGWVWTASLDASPGAQAGPMIQPQAPPPAAQQDASAAAAPPGGIRTVGPRGAPILTAPDGDTLAVASAGSDLQELNRNGGWVRVRLEGWMWMPAGEAARAGADATPAALEPSDLTADPTGHVGRVVSWTLQFISLERAEAVRTDFFEGEPFLLARFGGETGPFVYVPVPPERLTEVRGLVPLERIRVTARVRTGSSALTGTPIVDLLSIERAREAP
jgi:hypothetical protein